MYDSMYVDVSQGKSGKGKEVWYLIPGATLLTVAQKVTTARKTHTDQPQSWRLMQPQFKKPSCNALSFG
jgi:hypothetical protein